MQWLSGNEIDRCPLTNLSTATRRKYVAVVRKSLRRAIIDQKGLDAIQLLIPELGPNGVEPEFDE